MTARDRSRRFRRRLTLSHDGRPFLDRWGLVHDRIGGFYLHHIAAPDPGMDLHDHPWSFVSIILRGGYTEQFSTVASAVRCARLAELLADPAAHGPVRDRLRWSVRRYPLTVAHRITSASPGTWTLVLRGPTRRVWSFYPPTGKVAWTEYDYATRRPSRATGNRPTDELNPITQEPTT